MTQFVLIEDGRGKSGTAFSGIVDLLDYLDGRWNVRSLCAGQVKLWAYESEIGDILDMPFGLLVRSSRLTKFERSEMMAGFYETTEPIKREAKP